MIKKTVAETVEIIDVANKINHNSYEKKIKVFGMTVFTYNYSLHSKINEDKHSKLGFGQK